MRQATGADHQADEARLGPLLERTYAARAARLAPTDDALMKLNAALDAIGAPPRRHADHRRLFGACAIVALLLLLLSPVARSEFTASTRNAPRSVATSAGGAVGGVSLPAVAVAASAGPDATDRAPAANGAAPATGMSETPLRDLLARAGIRPDDPATGSSRTGLPPHH